MIEQALAEAWDVLAIDVVVFKRPAARAGRMQASSGSVMEALDPARCLWQLVEPDRRATDRKTKFATVYFRASSIARNGVRVAATVDKTFVADHGETWQVVAVDVVDGDFVRADLAREEEQ